MKLTFIPRAASQRTDTPSLTLRASGMCSFNRPAQHELEMEPGEAATLALDQETKQWVLVYYPNGSAEQCQLRGSKQGLCFSHAAACAQLFKSLPKELRTSGIVRVPLSAQAALAEDAAPGALLFVLEVAQMKVVDKAVPLAKRGARK